MNSWYYVFDGERGVECGYVKAPTLKEARVQLAQRHPNDVGADGELEDTTTGSVHFPWKEGSK